MATLPTFSGSLSQSNDAVYPAAVTYTSAPVTMPVTTPVVTAAPITTSAPITTTAPTRTLPPMTYSSTSTPPMSYAQGVPFSSSMNLGLGNLGNLGNLGLGGLGGLGLNKGKADSVFGPVNFKFVKDDEFEMRSQASPSRSAWGDLAGFPPPAESNHMQEANRLDMEIAAHDQKVRDLASQPLTVENLETQIQELLDGQESLRYELRQVKMQVEQNAHDLEGLRRQTGDAAFAGSGYGTQYLPPTAVSQPMPPMAMPQSAAPPTMPRMSTPQMSQPPAMAPSREVPPVPVSPQQSHQSHHSRSQRVSLPAKRHKDAVHAMMGYNEDTLDLQSTTDYFSKAKDSALSLSQTMRGYISSGFQSQK